MKRGERDVQVEEGTEVEESVCVCVSVRDRVCCRTAGHSTAPKGESQYRVRSRGRVGEVMVAGLGEGGNKAKVYESKGTPNYSYTIHD